MADERRRKLENGAGRSAFLAGADVDQSAFLRVLVGTPRARSAHIQNRKADWLGQWDAALDMRQLQMESQLFRCALEPRSRDQVDLTRQLVLGAIRALAHALEAKDAYTWGHSKRVSAYSVDLARELGLSVAETAAIALGGELHDIGKIGVREDILHKPGPLTPEEYHHVMQHTVIGARILSPLLHDRSSVLSVVRWHHERVDGSSLPDGLRGEEIPLPARIVAVADAFDAMTCKRSYRPALSVSAALRELEAHAGSQFDPDCVEAAWIALRGRSVA